MQDQLQTTLEQVTNQFRNGEFQQCLAGAKQLLLQAEQNSATEVRAETLFIQGSAQLSSRNYSEAESSLIAAAELFETIGMETSLLRCRLRQAKCFVHKHDFEPARNLIEGVRTARTAGKDELIDAELLAVDGLLACLAESDYETAISCYGAACDIFHRLGDYLQESSHKKNLAAFYSAVNQFDQAEKLLSESMSKLMELGSQRHVLDARINLALVAARRFNFEHAQNISYDCLDHASSGFEPAVCYRILYNLAIIEIVLENYTKARIHIMRLIDLPEFNLTTAQLGALQTLLAATDLVLEGPSCCLAKLETARQSLPFYSIGMNWTYLMLESLCFLAQRDVTKATTGIKAAVSGIQGAEIDVYAKIVHGCIDHQLKGRQGMYPPLAETEANIARQLQDELSELAPGIFAAMA